MTGGWRRWLWLLLALLGAGVAYAALGPADWQIRLGLHWLVEHFLVFFAATVLACVVYPKPMRVAAVLLPIAVGLEVAQGLTPDGPYAGRRNGACGGGGRCAGSTPDGRLYGLAMALQLRLNGAA